MFETQLSYIYANNDDIYLLQIGFRHFSMYEYEHLRKLDKVRSLNPELLTLWIY